ncbi:uncharacterized protein LOC135400843 [Ornithodoros turicata]|uniref:uncharacterized protein LOC135400843 n=1 Tax=Ornithodoros turicata TaxID=34597 RepID=UPI00313860F8
MCDSAPCNWLAVVEFLGEKSTSIVPVSWISDDSSLCVWPPPRISEQQRVSMVKRNEPPGKWRQTAIRVLSYAASYDEATKQWDRSLYTSSVETDTDECTSPDLPCTYTEITGYRECLATQLSGTVTPGNTNHPATAAMNSEPQFSHFSLPEPPPALRRHFATQRHVDTREAPSSTAQMAINTVPSMSSPEVTDVLSSHASSNQVGDRNILLLLVDIKRAVKSLDQRLQVMERFIERISQEKGIAKPNFPELPIQTCSELLDLETTLSDEQAKVYLIGKLSRLGGNSLAESVRILVKNLIKNSVALQYSLRGAQQKKDFSALRVYSCITEVLLKRHNSVTMKEVEDRIGRYLAGAPDREGGREARKRKKDTSQTGTE